MKNRIKLVILLFSGVLFISNQPVYGQSDDSTDDKKAITIADIWRDYTFSSKTVRGVRSMNDGKHYSVIERGENGIQLSKYAYETGELVEILIANEELIFNDQAIRIESYEFSSDEKKVLIATGIESIYRRSYKAHYYVFDRSDNSIQRLADEEKQMYADFSPAGDKVAYVLNNNLYYKDLSSDVTLQITSDGEYNNIINGASDWVYEEELELSQAFQWSADGQRLAFFRFDESAIKQWNMKMYDGLYPSDSRFKYPKAGEENSMVEIKIYDLKSASTIQADIGEGYEYLTAIHWTNDPNKLTVISSNRHQNKVKVHLVNTKNGSAEVIHTETSDTYIEMPFDIYFTDDQKHYVILSEKSGFRHLYMHDMNGNMVKQITKGDWPVTDYYGMDEKNGFVYFQSAEASPLERHVYRVSLQDNMKKTKLSDKKGTNRAAFSKSYDYFINYHTTANEPNFVSLHSADGKQIRVLEDNSQLKETIDGYQLSPKTFFSFNTSEGVKLNAWMIKPADFDENKKYPVFLTIYGGPGSQTVTDAWGGSNYFWHQMLAQNGYLVVSVDNRGTGARGVDFKKVTYKQLGKYETMDQIEAAKYFASLPYVDSDRIGVQGWSYGGYMSSLCLLKGAEYFKAAIAVAPVTNWRYYDSIYTERYMQTPQENPDGYDDNSPINHVEKLKGAYLLVHGMADDNVHLQNTTEMINALVAADKQFDLFVYPNKNHGIYGGNTRYHLYQQMTNFLKENL